MALTLRYAVRSDLGLVRTNNEDSAYAGPRLLAIADGMGGHAAGEVASRIVIGALEGLDEDRPHADLVGDLRDAVHDANERIADAIQHNAELDGMGTTLTALRFAGAQVGLVHVGDSRAYLLRGDLLSQITHDDTYVQFLVDEGKLTPDEAKDHPRRSVILRALLGTNVDPDVSIREAVAGDRYLLCTDGLTDVVSTETLLETLRLTDPQDAADRLVELALRGGGPDNVTVVVGDVVESRVGDEINDVPVIGGAFVEAAAADAPGDASPAERAAQIGRPKSPEAAVTPRRPRWRIRRTPLFIAVIVVVLVVGGFVGAYALTQNYYFVGKHGSQVAIFRGVNTQIGPVKFFNVYQNTDLHITDLNPSVRTQVNEGISANNKKDAEQIVQNLQGQLLPLCVVATPTPSITPTPTPSPTPATSKGAARTKASAATARRTTPAAAPTTSLLTGTGFTTTNQLPLITSTSSPAAPCRQQR